MLEQAHSEKSHQQRAYNQSYSQSEIIPFPDHKIEGDHAPENRRIISIGGGIGSDVAHLSAKNEVHILDYSQSSSLPAQSLGCRHHLIDLNRSDLQLPFANESIDIVVMKDILEHLLDPIVVLKEAKRVVASNGYIVISLPNHLNFMGRLRILFGGNLIWKGILHDHNSEYDEWNYMHIRFFTWKGIRKLLKQNDLSIVRTFFDFGPFGHYFSIPMLSEHLQIKKRKGSITKKGKLFLDFVFPLYKAANFLLPPQLRNWICKVSPGMLTSCFYFHVRKN